MANRYSGYSKTIREGSVRIVNGNHDSERKHLKAVSGCNGDQSARLELYEDYRCASKYGSFIQYVLFADVEYVSHMEMRHKEVITIGMQKGNKTFSFYADSQQSTLKWYRYCSLLFKIPNYGIPEIPKEDVAIQLPGIRDYCELHKYDTANKCVVNILSEGIRSSIGLYKLCVVEICNGDGTFNIYGFYTGKNLLTWQRDKIKLSGCLESLVFLEVDEACNGEPGLLWMKCPLPQSVILQKQIQEFLAACNEEPKTPSPTGYVFVDAAISNIHSKGDTDQLSQMPYEEQLSDNTLPPNTPISQSGTSMSSDYSPCSSGYSSDNSCGGSVGYKINELQLSYPIGTCKVLPKIAETEQDMHENLATLPKQTAPKISDNKVINSSINSLENECEPIYSNKSCKNKLQSNAPTLQKQCKRHISSTKRTRIPKPSSGCTRMPGFVSDGRYTSPATVFPSTVQEDELASENVSSLKQSDATDTTLEHQLEKIAFQKCSVIIVENLDISAILPHLSSYQLLTQKDTQTLLNRSTTAVEKAQYLLEALPRKDRGSFKKFKNCLRRTQYGTGHGDILKALVKSYHEEVTERNSQILQSRSAKEAPKAHCK